MGRRIASWLIRFAVMAVIYIVIANIIIDSAQGWGRLGRFGAAIGFAMHLVVVWAITIGIGHLIPGVMVRFVVHPVLMLLLFLATYLAISGWMIGTTAEFLWLHLEPFVALIIGVIVVDAVVGFLLERRLIAASRPTA